MIFAEVIEGCLDPGHPSETNSDLTSQNGTTENHINWVVTNLLKDKLAEKGYRIVMTKKSEEEMVTNTRRAQIANENNALFIKASL